MGLTRTGSDTNTSLGLAQRRVAAIPEVAFG